MYMKRISDIEVETFGRVLEAIGRAIQKKPELILYFIDGLNDTSQKEIKEKINEQSDDIKDMNRVENFALFDLAKKTDENVFMNMLSDFSDEELKFMLKHFHLGASKLKNKQAIIQHITEQAKKRTVDVFREHNPISSKT